MGGISALVFMRRPIRALWDVWGMNGARGNTSPTAAKLCGLRSPYV